MASTLSDNLKCDDEALGFILRELCLKDTRENRAQLAVLAEAMGIYQERESVRGGLWKAAGAKDSAHHLASKSRRITYALDHATPTAVIDDGLDAVNYAAFAVRNVRAGRLVST